MWRRLEG